MKTERNKEKELLCFVYETFSLIPYSFHPKFTDLHFCQQIAIGTDDVYKTAEAIRLCGGKVTREPGPLPGISTKIVACLDPDGWKSVILLTLQLCVFPPSSLIVSSTVIEYASLTSLENMQVFVDNVDFLKELE